MLSDVAVDGSLQVDERAENPRFDRRRVRVEKKPSTALSQDALVGVKRKVQRGWRTSQACTLGCLCVA
jgi:hypothetical protein